MGALDDVVRLIPLLSGSERDQLRQRLAAMATIDKGDGAGDGSKKADDNETWILDTVTSVLVAAGLERASMFRLKNSSDWRQFRSQRMAELLAYLDLMGTRIHKKALLAIGVDLLREDLNWMRVPVSALSIVRNLHRLPSVIDRHFPGYAKYGLLQHVIQAEVNHARQK